MEFKKKDIFPVDFKPFADFQNMRPCSNIKRDISYKAEKANDGRFTLEIHFSTDYLDDKDIVLTHYSHGGSFYVENDSEDIQDHVIDLGKKITLGDRETSLFLLRFEPNILASAGNNKDIPAICDRIIASLSQLGFFDQP